MEESRLETYLRENDGDSLWARYKGVVDDVGPFMDAQISARFREYTEHGSAHATRVVEAAEQWVIPQAYLCSGSDGKPLEPELVFVMLCSFWLHDIGMATGSEQLRTFLEADEELAAEFERVRKELEAAAGGELSDEEIEREFVRRVHHRLSGRIVRGGLLASPQHKEATGEELVELIPGDEQLMTALRDQVAAVCESHGQSLREWFRGLQLEGAAQRPRAMKLLYAAAVLRIADYLDIGHERAPENLWKLLPIASERSRLEWEKNMATLGLGWADESRGILALEATCREPDVHFALEDYCNALNREIEDTVAALAAHACERQVCVRRVYPDISPVVGDNEEPAYIPLRVRFEFEHDQMVRLLTGPELWKKRLYGVRELLQNALDAVRARQVLERRAGRKYKPEVVVRWLEGEPWGDGGERVTVLEVEDNGIGMDRYVIEEYFTKIGRCYYTSRDFHRRFGPPGEAGFAPISRFGIGILAAFLIGDELEVETVPFVEGGATARAEGISLRCSATRGWARAERASRSEPGTLVRVKVSEQFEKELVSDDPLAWMLPGDIARGSSPARPAHNGKRLLEFVNGTLGELPSPRRGPSDVEVIIEWKPARKRREPVARFVRRHVDTYMVEQECEVVEGTFAGVHARVSLQMTKEGEPWVAGREQPLALNGIRIAPQALLVEPPFHRPPMSLYDPAHRLEISLDRERILPCAGAEAFAEHFTPFWAERLARRLRGSRARTAVWDQWLFSPVAAWWLAHEISAYAQEQAVFTSPTFPQALRVIPTRVRIGRAEETTCVAAALRKLRRLPGERCVFIMCGRAFDPEPEANKVRYRLDISQIEVSNVIAVAWSAPQLWEAFVCTLSAVWQLDWPASIVKAWFGARTHPRARGEILDDQLELREWLARMQEAWGAEQLQVESKGREWLAPHLEGERWLVVLGGGPRAVVREEEGGACDELAWVSEAEFVVPPVEQWAPWLRKIVEEGAET